MEPHFTALDSRERFGEADFTRANRFDLGSNQNDAGLIGLQDVVFVSAFLFRANVFLVAGFSAERGVSMAGNLTAGGRIFDWRRRQTTKRGAPSAFV
jgi:hypothetical protein